MVKQVCTFYKDNYNLKSYKEYINGKLIVHSEYDLNNNKIYFESNYGDEPRFWYKRKFSANTKNELGEIIMYEDSEGKFKHIRYEGKKRIIISNSFVHLTRYDSRIIELEIIEINVAYCNRTIFKLKASKDVNSNYYYADSYEENSNYFTLNYARAYFEEIYYHDASLDSRKIIHVDEAYRITEYKDLLNEFNIIMHSKYYRPDSRGFRKFIPKYLVD